MASYGIKTQLDMNSLRQCRTEFEKHLKSMQELANRNVIQTRVGNINGQLNQTTQGLQGMNTQAKSFTDNIGYAIKRVAQFAIGMTAVYGAVRLVKEGIQEIADINKANVSIAMITGESVDNVEKMNQGWLDMAQNLKVVNSEVLAGAESWLRSGVSLETANKNLETTTKLSKIAGVDNKAMADSLIVIANQYDLNSKALEGYASKVSLLDNQSATSSEKINSAMQYSAETFKSVGIDMDTALSFITNYSEKSAQSGEAIGRGYRSMLTNFHKMKLGFDSGSEEEIGAVNRLETLLTSKGLALRKNKDEWLDLGTVIKSIQQNMGKFTEVQKSQLSFLIGSKEQAELTLSTLNNMDRINELKNKLKADDGAQALNESYSKYLVSIEAKKAELRNTLTGMWTKTISSDGLKTAITMLIEIVKVTEFLITDNKLLIASYVGLVVAIKNFTALKYAIGEVTAFMSLLRTEGLATLGLFNFNPVILAITALTAVIGGVIYAQYKHSEQVKELKAEYENLNESMGEMDGTGIKENTDKLKEQQIELDKLAKKASESYDVNIGLGYTTNGDKDNLNKFIETLEEAGYSVDKTKNKIIELGVAESNIATTNSIKAIQDKTSSIIDEANETQGLISQYMSLSQQENLSADKKTLLSGLSQQLIGRVQGLTTSVDKHGNMVITNTKLLGGQIDALEVLKQQSTNTANVEIENAIRTAQYISGGTMQTLDDMKKKLVGYQALSSALSNTSAGKGGFFDAQLAGIQMGVSNLQASISTIEGLKSKFEMKLPTVSSSGGSGYKPIGDKDKDTKDKQDVANLETKTDRYYKLESALQSVETELDKLSKLESNANEEDKLKLKEKEIKLLGDKKIALQNIYNEQQKENQLNVDILKKQGAKFDGQGNISNRNELLTSKTNASNKLTGDAKKTSQESVKQFEEDIKNYENVRFSKMSDTSSKIFTLEQDRIIKLKDLEIEKLDQKLKSIDKTYGAESQEIEDVKYRLEEIGASEEDSKETIQEKVKLTKDLVKATGDYNVKLLTGYGESLTLLNSTKEGTEEWDRANSKVEEFEDKLKSTNIEMLNLNKSNRDLVETQMESLIETQKKIQELQMEQRHKNEQTSLASSIYGFSGASADAVKTAYDKQNQASQDDIQAQIDGLNKVNDVQTEIETRLANQNSLIEKQTALQNAQNNKNVQTMIKNSDGSFQFKYIADVDAVESAQKAVDDQIKSNNDWEKSTALKHQTDSLNALKKSLADQKTAKDNDYSERLATLQVAQTNETNTMALHYTDMNLLVKTSLDTMVADYKGDWKLIIDQLTTDVGTATSLYAQLAAMQAGVGSINGFVGGGTGTTSTGGYTTTITDSSGHTQTQTQSSSEYYSSANQSNLSGLSNVPGVTVSTQKFARGGESSKTGMHWLDGEIGKPERVLSSTQTKDFGKLVQELPRTLGSMERMQTPKLNIKNYGTPMTYLPKELTDIGSIMDKVNLSNINNSSSKSGDTHHHYQISDVSFPNANSTDDIIRAFDILPNMILQKTGGHHGSL